MVLYIRGHEGRASACCTSCSPISCRRPVPDTVDANLELGRPADARDYGTGAQILCDLGALVRVVGEQPHRAHAEVARGSAHPCRSRGRQPAGRARGSRPPCRRPPPAADRPAACAAADAAALVAAHVQHHPAALRGDGRQRGVELGAAVAAQRAEHVAGEALGVHAHQHVLAVAVPRSGCPRRRGPGQRARSRRAASRSRMATNSPCGVGIRACATRTTCFSVCRRWAISWAMLISARSWSSANTRSSSPRAMSPCSFWRRSRRARRRGQPGEPGEVDGGLRVPGPAQHAALPAATAARARAAPVAGDGGRVGEQRDRPGPVQGRDAGGDPGPSRRRSP